MPGRGKYTRVAGKKYGRYAKKVVPMSALTKDMHKVQRQISKLVFRASDRYDALAQTISMSNLTTMAASCLTNIVQGTDIGQRIGDKISLRHLSVRGDISLTALNTAVSRVLIFSDKMNTGTAPIASDVLEYLAASVFGPYAPKRLLNFNQKRYHFYHDQTFVNISASSASMHKFDWEINLHDANCEYASNAAGFENGSVWILAISNLAAQLPTCNFSSSLTYLQA